VDRVVETRELEYSPAVAVAFEVEEILLAAGRELPPRPRARVSQFVFGYVLHVTLLRHIRRHLLRRHHHESAARFDHRLEDIVAFAEQVVDEIASLVEPRVRHVSGAQDREAFVVEMLFVVRRVELVLLDDDVRNLGQPWTGLSARATGSQE